MFSKARSRALARAVGASVTLVTAGTIAFAGAASASAKPFLARLHSIQRLASMVPGSGPAKGDQNPYGVAVIRQTTGDLVKGDVLVSDFNNSGNQQGTGSAIMEASPSGGAHVFAVVPKPPGSPAVGLTTALVELRSGFVVVGNLPAPGGSASAARAGALTILDSTGTVVSTITGNDINGPWDMTAVDNGTSATLFVTNVLNGTVAAKGHVVHRGTVVRIDLAIPAGGIPQVTSNRVIATGFGEHTDPNALVVGPTGVGLSANGTLYVADSSASRIAAVPNAMTRTSVLRGGGVTVTRGRAVNDPLGLAIAPDGGIITANGGDGNVVETTPGGRQATVKTLVRDGAGDLFGLAITPGRSGVYFVNDAGSGRAANSLELLR
jgi:hypothetical protein